MEREKEKSHVDVLQKQKETRLSCAVSSSNSQAGRGGNRSPSWMTVLRMETLLQCLDVDFKTISDVTTKKNSRRSRYAAHSLHNQNPRSTAEVYKWKHINKK